MRHHLFATCAALAVIAASLIGISPANAEATCSFDGDTLTVTFTGTTTYELTNRANQVIATDDGVETNCSTQPTGQDTDTLASIVLSSAQPSSPADVILHLDNPFTTTVGTSGDSSKLVLLDLRGLDRLQGKVHVDASHTSTDQHWSDSHAGSSENVDLDGDGDTDVINSQFYMPEFATGSGDDSVSLKHATYPTLFTSAGVDTVFNDNGRTTLGPGDDSFTGGGIITPGPGDDTVDMLYQWARTVFDTNDDGADHVIGAYGQDPGGGIPVRNQYVDYTRRTGLLNVSLDGVANDGVEGEHDNIEASVREVDGEHDGANRLTGSDAPNILIGGGQRDIIRGLGGNDQIDGRGGDDYESGNQGNDTFNQDAVVNGSDRILGGTGFDTVSYTHRLSKVVVSLDGKANDGAPGEEDLVDGYVNAIVGGHGWDTLAGDDAANRLTGGWGSDHLYGRGGNDNLVARDTTTFSSQSRKDYAYGGAGRDRARVDRLDTTYSVESRY